MRIHRIDVQNFRLLKKISVLLEGRTTLIVGRNNSGKTSLTELFRRLLSEKSPSFRLEDFSLAAHEGFWRAVELLREGKSEEEIRKALPVIQVKLTIGYDTAVGDLGALGDCIVDLDPNCSEALIVIGFATADGKVAALLEGFKEPAPIQGQDKIEFFRVIRDRIASCYGITMHAVDPNDDTNHKVIEWSTLSNLIQSNFISVRHDLMRVESSYGVNVRKSAKTSVRSADLFISSSMLNTGYLITQH